MFGPRQPTDLGGIAIPCCSHWIFLFGFFHSLV
jgi:hypothetical protein